MKQKIFNVFSEIGWPLLSIVGFGVFVFVVIAFFGVVFFVLLCVCAICLIATVVSVLCDGLSSIDNESAVREEVGIFGCVPSGGPTEDDGVDRYIKNHSEDTGVSFWEDLGKG